jgi:histidyl-tRNA synthetase
MKKIKSAIFLLIMGMVFSMFAGCSSNKLADIYSEDEVIERAKQVVEVINTLDYIAMTDELRQDLRDQLTADQLKEAWDSKLQKAGKFKEYKATAALGQKSKSTGEDYAVAVITCKYENSNLTFTIVLDKNLDVVGMYMK